MPRTEARLRYLEKVFNVQDEFRRQFIHENVKPKDIRNRILKRPGGYLAYGTVARFFSYGRGEKVMAYKRGPYATTLFAIAEALGFEVLTKRPHEHPKRNAELRRRRLDGEKDARRLHP